MTNAISRFYRLVPRGGPGLACDDDGLALGPVTIAMAFRDGEGRRRYRLRPPEELAQTLRLAYGSTPDQIIDRRCRGLARVAQLLTEGEDARARIRAVQLGFGEIEPDGMAKLAGAETLRKDSPHWADQPRVPAGNPGGGQWTGDGSEEDATNIGVEPAAARIDETQARKERFVDAHLADAQKAADKLGVPVQNILGLSALESGWGESKFAAKGNNYFGIHYPAPYATGYIISDKGTKVATFASYADSLKSFVEISGSLVRDKGDPEAFAAALQNSGKFGIAIDTGAKVPSYVRGVARTIRRLGRLVARRRI